MTKKLFLVLLLAVQTAFAQIISKDPTFASNGIYNMGNGVYYAWSMAQDSSGRIYSSYTSPNTLESFLFRLTANGALDPSFGSNGMTQLPYTYQNQIKIQADGKLVILGYNSGSIITRLLPNGQPDPTFGTNGSSIVPSISGSDVDARSYGLILQNEKIIVHGMSSYTQHIMYRLNTNGSIDTTFGNNGSISTQGAFPVGTFVLIDNQNNIICLSKTSSNNVDASNGSVIEKFNADGQPIISFGNNGILQTPFTLGYVGTAMVDSNNRVVYSNKNHEIFRINPDGTLDNTFNYNLNTYSGINGGAWIQSIVEKDGYYYIGGNGEGDFAPSHFISKLTQNGSIDSSFGYYSEINSNVGSIEEMVINNNNIITNGDGNIIKYLLNSATLSTTDITKTDSDISFENPIKESFVYHTKEKVQSIRIYTLDGKLIKNIEGNNTHISEVPKGVYMAKIVFENGKTSVKKLIKD
ncbi:T9SS type A sorting domain-containing protein [Chryseobacterium sp. YR221]|uniref:T9SS type A sorting domain-containing protein n=1 Tax=Chryseobacterium sp. YR221 TaxID=1500293 RepID=UPI0009D8E07D|nr:T9SS type A sorting domain-containing protein [Chryseobacterium sp. YR221]SMC82061.1 delta-60 repeat domain-containing protein/Por secretion system C-terminal sorting domain-containing protein [Chryseobacterium sp. YR221]